MGRPSAASAHTSRQPEGCCQRCSHLEVLEVEHEKVRWQLLDMNLKAGLEAGRRLKHASNVHTQASARGELA